MSWELCLLFHLLSIVFNLISSLDDLIWPTVKLVWDDLLKVLEQSKETKKDKSQTPRKQLLSNSYAPPNVLVSCFADLKSTTSNVGMYTVKDRETHVPIIWEWWRFLPWGFFFLHILHQSCYCLIGKLHGGGGDIPVTFPPCLAGWVQSDSSEGWPVPHGKLSPGPEERRQQ